MLKTLKTLFKQDKEKFVIPKSVQAIIPIKTIWEDGIFLVGNNKYAKTFKFEDINYSVASREDKEAMFLEYSELLNALDSGATTKITVNNRRLNKTDFEQTILIPMAASMRNTRPFSLIPLRSVAYMRLSLFLRPWRTALRASATMILSMRKARTSLTTIFKNAKSLHYTKQA